MIAAGQIMRVSDIPDELELPTELENKPNQLILNGGSCIIGPDGNMVTEQVFDKEEVIFADIDLDRVKKESMSLDVSGHYQRLDVFEFGVNKKRK